MNKKLLISIVLVLLLVSTALAAYSVTRTFSRNVQSYVRTYKCAGTSCTEGTVTDMQQKYGLSNIFAFSGTGEPDYYAVFEFPESKCYVPTAYSRAFSSSSTTSSTITFNFVQQDSAHCGSNLANSHLYQNNVQPGTKVTFGSYLEAAWGFVDGKVMFIPDDLNSYYDSKVDVKFKVNGQLKESRQVTVPMESHWLWQAFEFTPTEPGTYTLRIETSMNNDCKCAGSNTKFVEVTLTVLAPICGDSICNDGNSKTCEPNGGTKDDICTNNVDTGNLANGVCRTTGAYECTYCGDYVKQAGAGEQCDLGDQNGAPNSGCSATCQTVPLCGDSICNDGNSKTCEPNGETKDDLCTNNVDTGNIADGICRTEGTYACTYCGDNVKQEGAGEQCDLGNQNGVPGSGCSATCQTILPSCGDSLCNDGAGKTCEPNGPTQDFTCPDYVEMSNGVCRSEGSYACTYCGDNVKQEGAGEECDLGSQNGVPGSGCSATCQDVLPSCGDSLCNDGSGKTCEPNGPTQDFTCPNYGEIENDLCRTDGDYACTYCGDEVVQSGAGEDCDLGELNGETGSGCSATCENVQIYCGDSLCNDGSGKTCEPNGGSYDLTCPTMDHMSEGSCRSEGAYACTYCGDDILQSEAGEQCDDGNNEDGDGCSKYCKSETEIPEFSSPIVPLALLAGIFGLVIYRRK